MRVSPGKLALALLLLALLGLVGLVTYRTYSDASQYLGKGIELRARGRYEQALGMFRTALRFDPALADAHYQAALTHLEMGQFADCLAACAETLRLDPLFLDARRLQPLDDAAKRDPRFLDTYLRLARDHVALGLAPRDASVSAYAMAFDLAARISYERFTAGSARAAREMMKLIGGAKSYRLGSEVMSGRFDEALKHVEAFAAAVKDSEVGPALLEQLRRAADNHAQARETVALAAKLQPDLAAIDLLAARMQLDGRSYPDAIAKLEGVLSRFEPALSAPDRAERVPALRHVAAARSMLARAYTQQGRLDLAAGQLEKLLELTDLDESQYRRIDLRVQLARVYIRQRRDDDALRVVGLKPEASVDPGGESRDSRAAFVRGVVRLRRSGGNDPAEALVASLEFARAAADFPDWVDAHYALGVAQLYCGRAPAAMASFGAAVRSFEKGSELSPLLVSARLGAAAAALSQEAHEEAITRCDTVLDLQPGNRSALLLRSAARLDVGQFSAAEAELDQLATLHPDCLAGQLMRIAAKLARHPGGKTADQLLEHCHNTAELSRLPDCPIAVAFIQSSSGRLADARNTLQPLEANAADPTVALALARIDLIEGNAPQAAARLAAARKRWPNDAAVAAWARVTDGLIGATSDQAGPPAEPTPMRETASTAGALLRASYFVSIADASAPKVVADMLLLDPVDLASAPVVSLAYDASSKPALPLGAQALQAAAARRGDLPRIISDTGALYRASAARTFRQLVLRHLELWDQLVKDL